MPCFFRSTNDCSWKQTWKYFKVWGSKDHKKHHRTHITISANTHLLVNTVWYESMFQTLNWLIGLPMCILFIHEALFPRIFSTRKLSTTLKHGWGQIWAFLRSPDVTKGNLSGGPDYYSPLSGRSTGCLFRLPTWSCKSFLRFQPRILQTENWTN